MNSCPPRPYSQHPARLFYGAFFVVLAALGGYVFSAYDSEVLAWMQSNQQWLQEQMATSPFWGAVIFTVVFALVLGFYIPGGIVLMLLVGAIFPVWQANFIANFGNLAGAVIGFLLSRHVLRDEVQSCYGHRLQRINDGIRRSGWLYLLVLRIAPVLPSPLVNLGMGLTPMSLPIYAAATLVGRIPMTALYVNLGSELGDIRHLSELLSLEIILSLLLVGALMLAGHYWLRRCEVRVKPQ